MAKRPFQWRLCPISVHPARFETALERDKDAAKAIANGHQVVIRDSHNEPWRP